LLDSPTRMLTHLGWFTLKDGVPTPWETRLPQWATALKKEDHAHALSDADTLCSHNRSGRVQLWDTAKDKLAAERTFGRITHLRASANGCLVATPDKVQILSAGGGLHPLVTEGTIQALEVHKQEVFVVSGGQLQVFNGQGKKTETLDLEPGVRAIARRGDKKWWVGYRDGAVEALSANGTRDQSAPTLEQTPSSPVYRLLEDTNGLLYAGYADGTVALWNQADGALLRRHQLHGRVAHISLESDRFTVLTDLGDRLSWDMSVFGAKRCATLREIWQKVPVIWQDGRIVASPPPQVHPCRD